MENRPAAVWMTTLYGYDTLGRSIKTIRSASNPSYNLSLDPALSSYSPSANADQDLITSTSYDAQGRVLLTTDSLGSVTRPVYDGLNRQVRTIANFVDQGEDPSLWVWSSANNRWQKSGGTAIDHGTKNDQNIITESIYDSDGRVQETRDVLGRLSHNVYDSAGRLCVPFLIIFLKGQVILRTGSGTAVGSRAAQGARQPFRRVRTMMRT